MHRDFNTTCPPGRVVSIWLEEQVLALDTERDLRPHTRADELEVAESPVVKPRTNGCSRSSVKTELVDNSGNMDMGGGSGSFGAANRELLLRVLSRSSIDD
jgi:hypothetical protein